MVSFLGYWFDIVVDEEAYVLINGTLNLFVVFIAILTEAVMSCRYSGVPYKSD